ncbi:MAG: carboxylesterase family protein [Gammaproteobacteria bacterium]|nr:carboxylesterase family protein [Gammaproteobacteria bacterium]
MDSRRRRSHRPGRHPWYNGTSFARQGDIVTVSINYRLGALGFTDLSRFGEEFASSGACGTLDQIAALQWVQKNIAAFGGDPAQVTIAGESAGGFSVATLLASPETKGLFRAAIAQSGAGHHTLSKAAGDRVTDTLLDTLEISTIDELRAVSAEDVLAAQAKVDSQLMGEPVLGGVSAFYPVHGCPAIPEPPIDGIAAGRGADVNVLLGTNKDEATLFVMERVSEERPAKDAARYGGGDELLTTYREALPEANATDLVTAMSTHFTFRHSCVRLQKPVRRSRRAAARPGCTRSPGRHAAA